ncbi:class I SAM-dependent methyltransferase [bacterium 1XD42-54]|jgi:SAM-dependent methyltransferase|nr:class I SAM-dependent methyltransferase [bacterium 1XD42-54]
MEYNTTLGYYDIHADRFYKSTVNVEFATMQRHFLAKLRRGSYILDFGCGSGRDTKFFLEQGYRVDAVDGSKELCKLASRYTEIEVKNMIFQELSEVGRYDGIWACSSILHLPIDELAEVMRKMVIALKEKGIIYTSFKYGTFAGERDGRFFTDMTEETFAEFLSKIKGLDVEEQWITSDVRPGRGEEKWLNLILRKRQR